MALSWKPLLSQTAIALISSSVPVSIKDTAVVTFAMGTTILPVELLSAIVSFAAAEGSEVDSGPVLLSLCLASRVLHELSIRHLYHHVSIRCFERSLEEEDMERAKRPVIRSIRMCGTLESETSIYKRVRSYRDTGRNPRVSYHSLVSVIE